MFWRYWPFKRWWRRPASPAVGSSVSDEFIGPQTGQAIAWFDEFFDDHLHELREALDSSDAQGVPADPGNQQLPDFGWPYKATRLIGEGATGQVFQAADLAFSRTVAIKVSHVGRGDDEALVFQKLLAREQRHVGQLEHECMVRVYRGGRLDDGRLWYSMEYVPGEPLTEYVRQQRLNLKCAVRLFVRVAEAIAELHKLGIMHADLKPAHILISSRGQPKVIDFGLARVVDTAIDSSPQISNVATQHSCIGGGTPGYRAPELAAGLRGDVRSDVYSLGVILHELVTGSVPPQPHEVVDTAALDSCPSDATTSFADPQFPVELRAVVRSCMAENSNDRYSDAGRLATELSHWLNDLPVEAYYRPLSPSRAFSYRTTKRVRRHRKSIAVIGLIAGLAFILTGVAAKMSRSDARNQMLVEREQRRIVDEEHRTVAEQELVESRQSRQYGEAILSARQLLAQGRIDDARREVASSPFSQRGIECDLLRRQFSQFPEPKQIVGAHDWGVTAILGADRCLVSAGHDGRLVVWNLPEEDFLTLRPGSWSPSLRRPLRSFEDHQDAPAATAIITDLAWIDRGRAFISVEQDGAVVSWTTTDKQGRTLLSHPRPLLSVAVNSKGTRIAIGDDAGMLTICNEEGHVSNTTTYEGGAITSLAPAGEDCWWVGQDSGSVRIVNEDGTQLAAATLLGPIWDLTEKLDAEAVAVGCQTPSIPLLHFDASEGRLRESTVMKVPAAQPAGAQAVHAVQFSPAGDQLMAVDDLGRLTCFELPSGSLAFVRDDQGVYQLDAAVVQDWSAPLRRRSAGIAFIDRDKTFATAGGDTLIKLWRKNPPQWSVKLQVSDHPQLAFHRAHPELLWVGDVTGQLALVEAHSGNVVDRAHVGQHPIVGIAAAQQANLITTACGQSVHFWREHRQHIKSAHATITFEDEIDSLAIDSEGHRLAVQLVGGRLELRALPSGRAIASFMFGRGQGRRIAFDHTGKQLALLVGTTTHVLNTETLETQASFEMSVGKGTSLLWHPVKHDRIFIGDAVGRMASRPEGSWPTQMEMWAGGNPIIDLAVTGDGTRMLAATPTGRLIVIEPDRLGPLHTMDIAPTVTSPATQMVLAPNGQFVALGHEDGTVHLLRLADSLPPQPTTTHKWVERVHAAGTDAPSVRIHPWSVAIDTQGYLHALYVQTVPQTATAWRAVLGRETSTGWRTITLREYGILPPRGVDALDRSHTLRIEGDRWFAFAKLDVDASRDHATAPHLFIGTVGIDHDRVDDKIPLALDAHAGFDPFLAPTDGGLPSLVHFSHAGDCLLHTKQDAGRWTTKHFGRQGDGYRFHAAVGETGLHLLFRPTRFNGDRSLPIVLGVPVTGDSRLSLERRDHFSDVFHPTVLGLTLDRDGEPVVLYRTGFSNSQHRLQLAHRQDDRWQHHTIFEQEPLQLSLSDLTRSPRGEIAFAAVSQGNADVWYVTYGDGTASVERVWQGTERATGNSSLPIDCALHYAPDGKPVVLVAFSDSHAGYIRTFRPAF